MQREHVRSRGERRGVEKNEKSKVKSVLTWTFEIIVVILFAYILVYFFGQVRTNVGQSMDLTLSGGDKVLINTLSYKMGGPSRNDIISFKPGGSDTSHSYIKRVVGLPGETVQIKDGMIYINDKVFLEEADYPAISAAGLAAQPIVLGATEYFVIGDNRNNSEDSRYADIGNVNIDNIEGKVWLRISPASQFGFVK